MMSQDLVNLKAAAAFLSKTEIKFDLVSAVVELQKQIKLEFEFKRCAVSSSAAVMHNATYFMQDIISNAMSGCMPVISAHMS